MALFDLTDLAAYVQSDVDTATATVARDIATGLVVGYTNQAFEADTYTHVLPVAADLSVRLPQRPVTAVTTVTVDGDVLTVDDDYTWDAITPLVQLLVVPDVWTATVVYDAGYATVPAVVKAVALAAAARAYANPGGVVSEAIDDYSVTYDTATAGGLLPAEMNALRRYRSRVGSITVGSL